MASIDDINTDDDENTVSLFLNITDADGTLLDRVMVSYIPQFGEPCSELIVSERILWQLDKNVRMIVKKV